MNTFLCSHVPEFGPPTRKQSAKPTSEGGLAMTRRSQNENVWSIVLAAGDGERLKPFVRQWLGYEKPKQYCAFVGTRSMLQHTLDRADEISAPRHKVTIVALDHRRRGWPEQLKRKAGRLVVQPSNQGTATAVFFGLSLHPPRSSRCHGGALPI